MRLPVPMDEETMSVGLLVEAARAQQKAAERILRKWDGQLPALCDIVRAEVRATLDGELISLKQDCASAARSLDAVRRAASLRIVSWSVAIAALSFLVPLALAYWTLPSIAEIRRLRAQRDAFASEVALLDANGGRADIRRCGADARLCVRVDRSMPMYGERSDYLVVKGY